jgi:hypothetical protein
MRLRLANIEKREDCTGDISTQQRINEVNVQIKKREIAGLDVT